MAAVLELKRRVCALWRDRTGMTAVEFALILPIISILIIGTIEFGRLVLLSQKLQNGTFILSDLAARDETLSVDQLDSIFLSIGNIIQPFEFATSGTAILTSVSVEEDGDTVVNWQRAGAGSLVAVSEVGAPGGTAALPPDLALTEGETILVSEVFYDFEPIFGVSAAAQTIHKMSYVKPRLGTLDTLLP